MTGHDPWRGLRRVFRLPATGARLRADVDEELRFHLQGRIEELMSQGMSREEAEAEARRRFGDEAAYGREAREIDERTHRRRTIGEHVDDTWRETRRGARALRRAPRFSLVALLTLALGLGAATAIYTMLDAIVLRPLAYAGADRLVKLSSPVPKLKGQTVWGIARHEMFYFLGRGHTLSKLGLYQLSDVTAMGSGGTERSERIRAAQASASLFDVLAFHPQLGRLLTVADNESQQPTVVVLGNGYWTRRFGADPGVVGKTIDLEGYPMTVVGVLPAGAELPDITVDLWMPAYIDSARTIWNNHTWSAIGRLAPGVTVDDAQRELAALTMELPAAYPSVYGPNWLSSTGFTTRVEALRDAVVGATVTRALWAVFGAVALVLLIAGANVANLFVVRQDARGREVAMRIALGAERRNLAAYHLAESLLLTLSAGVLAVAIAAALLRLLLAIAPSELPRLAEVHLDGASVTFALGVALVAGVILGLFPLFGARLDLGLLRDGGRGATSSRARMAFRGTMVTTQMAFAVVLLAAALLMVQTFRNLRGVRPGFDARGVLTLDVALPEGKYSGDGKRRLESVTRANGVLAQLSQRVRALPGVRQVGMVDRMPLVSGDWCIGITLEGPTPEAATGSCPPSSMVTPGYFETMGIHVDGRTLDWTGMNGHDGAVVVSRAFADHHWPGQSPIGKGMKFQGSKPPFYRVVGVADDVRGLGVDAPPPEYVYFPSLPLPDVPLWGSPTYMHLVVKSSDADPAALGSAITRIVQELEPQAAVANVQTMETVLARSYAKQSFTMVLLLVTATISLILSAVGIYGVISYVVMQRRPEIGVRLALGADAGRVTGLVVAQSVRLAVVGVIVGVVAALGVTRYLQSLLFGVSAADPKVLSVVAVSLLALAALASFAPARRAARVDPAEVLRAD